MRVSYKGFTGELVKLERGDIVYGPHGTTICVYALSIYDEEKEVTHSFKCARLSEVKLLGASVSLG